ncbi:unnamed protein product [Arctogadus glacialis]
MATSPVSKNRDCPPSQPAQNHVPIRSSVIRVLAACERAPAQMDGVVLGAPAQMDGVVLGAPAKRDGVFLGAPAQMDSVVLGASAQMDGVFLGASAQMDGVVLRPRRVLSTRYVSLYCWPSLSAELQGRRAPGL